MFTKAYLKAVSSTNLKTIVFFAVIMMGLTMDGSSQVLIQLELYDNPKAIKYGPGSSFTYLSNSLEDWKTENIESIDYENQIVVFTSGYEHVDNITKVKRYKPWVRQLGLRLMQFSAAWFLYGGIAQVATSDFDFGWDHAGIGGGAFLTGFVLYKVASSTTYDVKGGKDRLRIIDISWPDPKDVYKK